MLSKETNLHHSRGPIHPSIPPSSSASNHPHRSQRTRKFSPAQSHSFYHQSLLSGQRKSSESGTRNTFMRKRRLIDPGPALPTRDSTTCITHSTHTSYATFHHHSYRQEWSTPVRAEIQDRESAFPRIPGRNKGASIEFIYCVPISPSLRLFRERSSDAFRSWVGLARTPSHRSLRFYPRNL